MKYFIKIILFLNLSGFMSIALSEPASRLEIQKVTDNVYALVGQRGPMSKWNFGTNATFGVVITDEGVVLIDPGASDHAARYIHQTIKNITDKPIVLVINTGSEDLRWLGNAYFKSLGANIITNKISLNQQKLRADGQIARLDEYIFPKFSYGTTDVYADVIFENEKTITLGTTSFVLKYSGPAYTQGDFYVWLPKEQIVFSGDIISTQRMLAVARDSNTASWLRVFKIIETLKPKYIVPGHGHVSDIKKARADTYLFLKTLRNSVESFMKEGGQIEDVSSLKEYPLSPYERLIGFEMLLGRNALHVYMEMEWE